MKTNTRQEIIQQIREIAKLAGLSDPVPNTLDVPNETGEELVDVSHIRYVDMKDWPSIESQQAYWKNKECCPNCTEIDNENKHTSLP